MDSPFARFFNKGETPPMTTEDATTPTPEPAPIEMPSTNDKIKKEYPEATGKLIKVSDQGWGFISSKDIKFTRIFFHWTSLKQDTLKFTELKNGMKVKFIPVEIEGKGFRAIKISVLKDAAKS